ncbi:MAG: hypothetical protein ACRDST_23835 [Pseudonocardiaceae bacterium]
MRALSDAAWDSDTIRPSGSRAHRVGGVDEDLPGEFLADVLQHGNHPGIGDGK